MTSALTHVSRRTPAQLVALAVLLASCDTTVRLHLDGVAGAGRDAAMSTEDGGKRDSGSGGGGDSGDDAGRDVGVDAGWDSGVDGGGVKYDGARACRELCWAATPHCDVETGECVECLRDGDCDVEHTCRSDGRCVECESEADCDGDELCTADGRCGTCTSNADCPGAARSHCKLDNSSPPLCLSCEGASDCEHIAGRPYCSPQGCTACRKTHEATDCAAPTPRCSAQGNCEACTPETEAADCGAFSCDRTTLECTTVERGSQLPCEACQADSECASGLYCARQVFQPTGADVFVGTFCFPKANDLGCITPPYSKEVPATSVDGMVAVYCMPVTTCAAVLDTRKSCTTNHDCGLSGLDDGECHDLGGGEMRCTFACNGLYDCPGFTECSSPPGECVPFAR